MTAKRQWARIGRAVEQEADLDDPEPIAFSPRRAAGPAFPPAAPQPARTTFSRHELTQLLDLYGRKVAAGEWRDYAIDFGRDHAVFSVYRRSSECALYRIEKCPRLARKQGAWSVVSQTGLILKRGHDLRTVLGVLEKRLSLV
ncbi:MAG: DUF2794 domain-containing protein [Hyphomicrobiaceae bacterium]